MYKFTDQQQEDKFNLDFDESIESFLSKSQKKKKSEINCTLSIFLKLQSATRLIKSQFFETKNMNFKEFSIYNYLNYLWKGELYEFTPYEISIFNPSF